MGAPEDPGSGALQGSANTCSYRRYGLYRVAEVFFDAADPPVGSDLIYYQQLSHALAEGSWQPFDTILVDLGDEPDALVAKMNSSTRNEIRRADQSDDLIFEQVPAGRKALADFADFFDSVSPAWGARPISRSRLNALSESGLLSVTRVASRDVPEATMCTHAYVTTSRRARLLYSASTFRTYSKSDRRQLVGRANRWLHWQDILAFRNSGLEVLDLGGVNPTPLRREAFKTGFGGRPVQELNGVVAQSLRGTLVTQLQRLHHRASKLHTGSGP